MPGIDFCGVLQVAHLEMDPLVESTRIILLRGSVRVSGGGRVGPVWHSAGAMASAPRSLPRNKFLWLLRSSRSSFADTTTDNDHAHPIDDSRERARSIDLRDVPSCLYFDHSPHLILRAPDALGASRVLLRIEHLSLTNTPQDGSHARPLPLGHPQ